jgi:hypothetical protein
VVEASGRVWAAPFWAASGNRRILRSDDHGVQSPEVLLSDLRPVSSHPVYPKTIRLGIRFAVSTEPHGVLIVITTKALVPALPSGAIFRQHNPTRLHRSLLYTKSQYQTRQQNPMCVEIASSMEFAVGERRGHLGIPNGLAHVPRGPNRVAPKEQAGIASHGFQKQSPASLGRVHPPLCLVFQEHPDRTQLRKNRSG